MMFKSLFYIISLFPKKFFIYILDFFMYFNIHKLSTAYKITKRNLEIAYPSLSSDDIDLTSKLSFKETIISGYETIYTWGRNTIASNNCFYKIENNFLLEHLMDKDKGLIVVSIHNRSVDMLLKWLNSRLTTVTLYKKVKNKYLDRFVKKQRELNKSMCVPTNISGVRKILKSLKQKKAVCFAADQVPQRGMGEYIKFFNREAYSTTLVQNLAARTNAPVIYIFSNSNQDRNLYISIKPSNNDIYNDSKHKLLINNNIEKIISQRPIDYSWEYKRFKKAKPPLSDPYKNI